LLVKSEVRRFPRLMRNVILLRDTQGLPTRDVTEQLGITVPAAKSRLVRARADMRRRMTHHNRGVRGTSPLSRTAVPLKSCRPALRGAGGLPVCANCRTTRHTLLIS